MRDWLKILLAVGGGAAVALVIALPIVLTGDEPPSVPEDPGQNRNAKNVCNPVENTLKLSSTRKYAIDVQLC